ncbi:MAG: rhodanese-like domain-containing protein [Planktotalea sp.]|uniref:rhodanese-like domain-containing protein n=1 Tax=Planktotalea sp. TaxID=2029877 RepID=UPI003C738927
MQKRTFLLAGAGIAAAAAAAFGLSGRASADNLTLESPSGSALASDANTLLVDIRQPQEWKETGVIEGALLMTYTGADAFLKAVTPKLKDGQRLALICRSGNRTSRASAQIAGKVDFPVVDIAGGMGRVLREGYRPVKPTRKMGCQSC